MKNTEKLIFIFALGLLCLNWPLIEIFRTNILPYLFIFWLLFILFVALASSRVGKDEKHNRSQ